MPTLDNKLKVYNHQDCSTFLSQGDKLKDVQKGDTLTWLNGEPCRQQKSITQSIIRSFNSQMNALKDSENAALWSKAFLAKVSF